eukprot:767283-Hanusia_phi.AAC.3
MNKVYSLFAVFAVAVCCEVRQDKDEMLEDGTGKRHDAKVLVSGYLILCLMIQDDTCLLIHATEWESLFIYFMDPEQGCMNKSSVVTMSNDWMLPEDCDG